MNPGMLRRLRTWFSLLLEENERDIAAERGGWTNYIMDIYAAHARLHHLRQHDRRRQQWKNYEHRGKRKP